MIMAEKQLIIPNILRGFGMLMLFIGVWLYTLGNLPSDAMLGAAAVFIIVRTMIGPGMWSLIFNYIVGFWDLEAFTNMAGKMDLTSKSQRTAGVLQDYKT
jgi:DHA2 family multidrug resistance protein